MADFSVWQWFTVVWFSLRLALGPAFIVGAVLARSGEAFENGKKRLWGYAGTRVSEDVLLVCLIIGGFYG